MQVCQTLQLPLFPLPNKRQFFTQTTELQILLKTAVATVSNSNRHAETNILFDEDSQRSFMSQFMVNTLQLQPFKKEMIYLSEFVSQTPSPQRLQVSKFYLETKTGTKLRTIICFDCTNHCCPSSKCCSITTHPVTLYQWRSQTFMLTRATGKIHHQGTLLYWYIPIRY